MTTCYLENTSARERYMGSKQVRGGFLTYWRLQRVMRSSRREFLWWSYTAREARRLREGSVDANACLIAMQAFNHHCATRVSLS